MKIASQVMPYRNDGLRWLRRPTSKTERLDDGFQRDGNSRNRSRESGHTTSIVYRRVLSNWGQALRCVGA